MLDLPAVLLMGLPDHQRARMDHLEHFRILQADRPVVLLADRSNVWRSDFPNPAVVQLDRAAATVLLVALADRMALLAPAPARLAVHQVVRHDDSFVLKNAELAELHLTDQAAAHQLVPVVELLTAGLREHRLLFILFRLQQLPTVAEATVITQLTTYRHHIE